MWQSAGAAILGVATSPGGTHRRASRADGLGGVRHPDKLAQSISLASARTTRLPFWRRVAPRRVPAHKGQGRGALLNRRRDELSEDEERWIRLGRVMEQRDALDRVIRLLLDAEPEDESPPRPPLRLVR